MSVPPPLSAASVDRMGAAVEQADRDVDAGADPTAALAKAARDHGLPVGHVPIAVRAFNTGRAVRQLGAGPDPWTKAADYPSTTADAVVAALSAAPPGPEKRAADLDYAHAPGRGAVKAAAAPVLEPSAWTRSAVTKLAAVAPVPAAPAVPPHTHRTEAAALFDALRDRLVGASPATFAGIKAAAEYAHPGCAADVFGFLEAHNQRLSDKAAAAGHAAPDPTVTTDHPAVAEVGRIGAIRAAYAEPDPVRPLGYAKVAGAPDWYVRRPPIGLLSVDPPAEGPLVVGSPDGTKAAGVPLVTPFLDTLAAGTKAVTSNPVVKPLFDPLVNIGDPTKSVRADPKLDAAMKGITAHADLQNIVSDPRLSAADPKTVIQTYQELSQLAPNVMRNPAIASDMINRRVQTGPLSAFDLKTLLDMEKTYIGSRPRPAEDDDD